jgi:hypothetical protein
VTFVASANNNGSVTTINVNGKGAKNVFKPGTTTAPNIKSGRAYTLWYNGTSFFWQASAEGNAVVGDVLAGKIFSNDDDSGIVGTIPSKTAQTFTPTTTNQTIASGQYLSGVQTILGDADLVASNIKKDVNLFNVVGTLENETLSDSSRRVGESNIVSTANNLNLTGILKQFTVNTKGVYRVLVALRTNNSINGISCKIYKNGNFLISTSIITSTVNVETFVDVTLNVGDQLQLRLKNELNGYVGTMDYVRILTSVGATKDIDVATA